MISQSRLVAAIVDQLYDNKEQINKVETRVSAHDKTIDAHNKRLEALEMLSESKTEEEYISQEQCGILRDRVKAKGKPATIWAKFRLHFEITRYQFLPRRRFREALDWLEQYNG